MRRFAAVLLATCCAAPLAAQSIHVNARLEDLESRARTDSTDAVAYYNLALGYLSHERWNDADTALGRALALDPQLSPAWLARSVAQNRNDRFWNNLKHRGVGDSAVTAELKRRVAFERRAYLLDPFVDLTILGGFYRIEDDHDEVAYWLGRTYARYADGFRTGIQALVEGDPGRAYDGFELAKGAFYQVAGTSRRDSIPENLLFLHGMAAARSNHLDEAATDFQLLTERSIRAEDKDTVRFSPLRTNEYRYMLAAVCQRQGERERALGLYREVADNDLGNYMAHVQMARLYEAAGDWEHALLERRRAADIDNDDYSAWYDLGSALSRVSELAPAESAFVRAREMQPRDARIWYRLGLVEQRLGRPAEAREDLTRFLALAPSRLAAAIADARQRLATLQ